MNRYSSKFRHVLWGCGLALIPVVALAQADFEPDPSMQEVVEKKGKISPEAASENIDDLEAAAEAGWVEEPSKSAHKGKGYKQGDSDASAEFIPDESMLEEDTDKVKSQAEASKHKAKAKSKAEAEALGTQMSEGQRPH